MRSVVRVSAYVPEGSFHGRRVGGVDEDSFTLGATALERALGDRGLPTEPLELHLVGEFPPMADWGFPAVIGAKARIFRHAGTAEALQRSIRTLEADEGGPALILVAELPERALATTRSRPAPVGAGAVAYLLNPSNRPLAFPLERFASDDSALALSFQRLSTNLERPFAQVFVGDWDVDPAAGKPVDGDALVRAANRDVAAVSEGAYVSRARYLENLPSRWRFVIDECDACHELTFPARGICGRCRRKDTLHATLLPRNGGRVVAITTIGPGGQPTEFDPQVESQGPYSVAMVELGGSTRVTLQVTDAAPGTVEVGDPVNTVLRRLYPMEGEWRYGRKAVPAIP